MLDEQFFYDWMINKKGLKKDVAKTNISRIKRINAVYDLFTAYFDDECEYLLSLFDYSKYDEKQGLLPSHDIIIDGNYYTGTKSLQYALKLYVECKNDDDYFEKWFKSATSEVDDEAFAEVLKSYQEMGPVNDIEVREMLNQLKDNSNIKIDDVAPTNSVSDVTFKGNLQAFLRYIGPFCKNYVNSITRSERKRHRGICEYCGKKAVLDSAHKDGEDRPIIIKKILEENFKQSEDFYEVDVLQFEKMFKEAHLPVEEHIFFLCKECHTEYDKGTKITTTDILAKRAD